MRALKSIDNGMFFNTEHGLEKNKNAQKVDKQHIVEWFKDFPAHLGEVIPLHVRKQRKSNDVLVRYLSHKDVTMIPAYFTWKKLFDEYCKYSKDSTHSPPSLRSFELILHQECPLYVL
jgi:hypothetical protein